MQKIEKILVIEVAGIGDVVMSVPALRALRERFPQAYIAVLVSPRASTLLASCPYINEIFAFSASKTISYLSVIPRLRWKKFDAAINLYQIASFWGNLRMKMLFQFIRPKLSVGRSRKGWGRFFDLKFAEDVFSHDLHEVETKLKVVGLLQAVSENKQLELWPNSEDEHCVEQLLREFQLKTGEALVGINPNALQEVSFWAEANFAQVADVLIEKFHLKVIFLGSGADKARVHKILSYMKNQPINLVGRLSLNQYAVLTKRLTIFITLDSGPMHLASVFGAPTIALFARSGNPQRFGPYLNPQAIILQAKPEVKVDQVLTAVERLNEKQ